MLQLKKLIGKQLCAYILIRYNKRVQIFNRSILPRRCLTCLRYLINVLSSFLWIDKRWLPVFFLYVEYVLLETFLRHLECIWCMHMCWAGDTHIPTSGGFLTLLFSVKKIPIKRFFRLVSSFPFSFFFFC